MSWDDLIIDNSAYPLPKIGFYFTFKASVLVVTRHRMQSLSCYLPHQSMGLSDLVKGYPAARLSHLRPKSNPSAVRYCMHSVPLKIIETQKQNYCIDLQLHLLPIESEEWKCNASRVRHVIVLMLPDLSLFRGLWFSWCFICLWGLFFPSSLWSSVSCYVVMTKCPVG